MESGFESTVGSDMTLLDVQDLLLEFLDLYGVKTPQDRYRRQLIQDAAALVGVVGSMLDEKGERLELKEVSCTVEARKKLEEVPKAEPTLPEVRNKGRRWVTVEKRSRQLPTLYSKKLAEGGKVSVEMMGTILGGDAGTIDLELWRGDGLSAQVKMTPEEAWLLADRLRHFAERALQGKKVAAWAELAAEGEKK